ncbi:MAG: elongation factor Ts [Aquificae bacterium]|nr:elongation factor Ts [Aquificota bacterium]
MNLVKQLREMTGAGMLDCKKALEEAGGDLEKAKEILRKKGLAKAAKKASRETKEGLVVAAGDAKRGVLLEVNCETDFVARNELFQDYVRKIAELIAREEKFKNAGLGDVEELKRTEIEPGKDVDTFVKEAIAKIGENIQIKRFARFDAEEPGATVATYIHPPGRIGAIVEVVCEPPELCERPEVQELIKDVLLQIAAMRPEYLSPEEVPAEVVQKEKEIYVEQARREGKPEHILERIAEGKLKKFFQEKTLLEQPFIKEEKKSIRKLVDEVSKKVGGKVTIRRFARFELGQ